MDSPKHFGHIFAPPSLLSVVCKSGSPSTSTHLAETAFISHSVRSRIECQKAPAEAHKGSTAKSANHIRNSRFNHVGSEAKSHHPSPPAPPVPPTAALNSFFAYSKASSSKLPGWSHTAGTPASFASRRICLVMAGWVMTLREVCNGWLRADGEAIVG